MFNLKRGMKLSYTKHSQRIWAILLFSILLSACAPSVKEIAIEPPFKEVELPRQELTLDPSKEHVVKFESGLTIDVPANAFVDANGNEVTGEVTLQLKTFETPAEIIASGIPMTFEDGDHTRDFESAGMFQIQGVANGEEIAIAEGKDLAVNYPSGSVGEYDFFYFEESESEGITKGHWQQLSEPKEPEKKEAEGFGTFKLQFDDTSYAELAPLSEIDWKAATELHNPLNAENKWVLDEKWTMLDVTQPKHGFGKKVFGDSFDYWWGNSLLVAPDSQSFLITRDHGARLWSRNGKLLLEVKGPDKYSRVETLGENHFCARYEDANHVYDFDGTLKGKMAKSFGHQISSDDTRIVCKKFGEPHVIWLYSIEGTLLKTLNLAKYEHNWESPGIYEHFILSENDEIITNDANGVSFYDLDGNLLKNRSEICRNIHWLAEGQLLLERLDHTLVAWNYKASTEIACNQTFNIGRQKINDTIYRGYANPIPKTDWIEITEARKKNSILWNYKTGDIRRLNLQLYEHGWGQLPSHLMEGYSLKDSTFHIYNLEQGASMFTIANYDYPYVDGSYHGLSFSEDGKHFILTNWQFCRLYTADGNLIRDFTRYDSTISNATFLEGGQIATVDETGIYRKWNLEGKELSSLKLRGSDFVNGWVFNDFIRTWGKSVGLARLYDLDGNLLMSNWRFPYRFSETEVMLVKYRNRECAFTKLFDLEKGVYQLSLKSEYESFYTYVYLTQQQKQIIEEYEQAKLVRLNVEKNRQKVEARVVRRFAIKKFGIYNYDRFVNDKSRIHLAASFDFGQAIDFNNITVFLITDFNGPSVVKFYKSTWDKFSFDPSKPNRLLAVLPDDKVAYFSQADFDQLDIEAIKQARSYKFSMKVSDQPISELIDLEKVLQ